MQFLWTPSNNPSSLPSIRCAPGVDAEVLGVWTTEEGPPGSGLETKSSRNGKKNMANLWKTWEFHGFSCIFMDFRLWSNLFIMMFMGCSISFGRVDMFFWFLSMGFGIWLCFTSPRFHWGNMLLTGRRSNGLRGKQPSGSLSTWETVRLRSCPPPAFQQRESCGVNIPAAIICHPKTGQSSSTYRTSPMPWEEPLSTAGSQVPGVFRMSLCDCQSSRVHPKCLQLPCSPSSDKWEWIYSQH